MEGLVVDIIKPFKVSLKTPFKTTGLGPNGISRWDADDAPSGCPWCAQFEDHDVLDCPKASPIEIWNRKLKHEAGSRWQNARIATAVNARGSKEPTA
jgi:hypothetical protein